MLQGSGRCKNYAREAQPSRTESLVGKNERQIELEVTAGSAVTSGQVELSGPGHQGACHVGKGGQELHLLRFGSRGEETRAHGRHILLPQPLFA